MELKTKAQYAEQVRKEHLDTALSTPDAELKEWSRRVYADFKSTDNACIAATATAKELDLARQGARTVHRRQSSAENTAAWRSSVTAAEEANKIAREVRAQRGYNQALSELLATLLRERRTSADNNNPSTEAINTNLVANNTNNDNAGGATSTPTATAAEDAPIQRETCPFCTHIYTVRDGTLPQVDAEGNRLQLRRCMCRNGAPPCKNCPNCKLNPLIMTAKDEEQQRLCRDEFKCEICACECPGAGKWVHGDEVSRSRFRERTAKRHAELSALLQGSWDDKNAIAATTSATNTTTAVNGPPLAMRRLPADIKDQILAAHAAESLFSALEDSTANGALRGGGMATTSNHQTGCGGRMCCGEAITTVKRRKIEDANDTTTEYGRGHRQRGRLPLLPPPARATAAAAVHAEPGSHYHQQYHQHQHEGCGDHCDHEHHHNHHHHSHVHRCDHPHDECTSDCCSAISMA
jgi:hypothetical protein